MKLHYTVLALKLTTDYYLLPNTEFSCKHKDFLFYSSYGDKVLIFTYFVLEM